MLKKFWGFVQNYVLVLFEKPLLDEGGQALEKMLEKFREKNQEASDALVVSLYMLVTTVGVDVVASTATPYDDKALAETKAELIEYAEKHNITLPEINK